DDLDVREPVAPVGDVLPDRGMEQQRLLRDDAEESTVGRLPERPQIAAVDRDRAAERVVEAQDEVGERRLAGPARSGERHDLALLDLEAHTPDPPSAAIIEGDVPEDDP